MCVTLCLHLWLAQKGPGDFHVITHAREMHLDILHDSHLTFHFSRSWMLSPQTEVDLGVDTLLADANIPSGADISVVAVDVQLKFFLEWLAFDASRVERVLDM